MIQGSPESIQSPEFRERMRRAHKAAVRLAGAMIAGLPFYLAAVEILRAARRPFAGFVSIGDCPVLRYVFYAAAVAVVIVLRLVNAALLRSGRMADGRAAIGRLSRANAVTMVLAEIPALIGFGLFLVGGFNRDFYVLFFVSAVLMFMYFPRLRTWEAHLQNAPTACPF